MAQAILHGIKGGVSAPKSASGSVASGVTSVVVNNLDFKPVLVVFWMTSWLNGRINLAYAWLNGTTVQYDEYNDYMEAPVFRDNGFTLTAKAGYTFAAGIWIAAGA
jgi:hypothetical protein